MFYYSEFLGTQTNNYAELFAIAKGLELCWEKGINKIWVETDSQVAISLIVKDQLGHWTLQAVLTRIRAMCALLDVRFTHIYREANAVADYLANEECCNQGSLLATVEPTQGRLKGLLRLDRLGCPYIRCK